MAHGVEGRVPFLDKEIAAFGFFLEDTLKIRRSKGKWILRLWLDKILPEARAFSKKRGFTVPVGEWIKTKANMLGPMIANQEGIQEVCNREAVNSLFRNFSGSDKKLNIAAWSLLYYALWHNYHVLGHHRNGDILDTLSAS